MRSKHTAGSAHRPTRSGRLRSVLARLGVGCAAAGALALGGCGSSSSSGLSKAQLAASANAACSAYTTAAARIPQPSDFVTNPVAAAAYLDKLKPLVAKEESTLLALKPSSSVKPLWDQIAAAGTHVDALFYDADAKAHAKNRAGLVDLEQGASYKQSTLNALSDQLGATACAK